MTPTTLIKALVDAPPIVEVSPRAKTVSVTVRTELRNVSDHDYVLQYRMGSETHFWHLLDQKHRELARAQPRKTRIAKKKYDLHPACTKTIASGHSTHETETLKLDATKLKDGQTYTIRYEILGQIAEASFVVVRPQKAPVKKAPPKKKEAAKKTAKKAVKTTKKAAKK